MAPSELHSEPPLASIDEDNSYHSAESLKRRRDSEVYPDDSASGFHSSYHRQSSEEKMEELRPTALPPPVPQQQPSTRTPPPARNLMPDAQQKQSFGIELDHDTSMPSLDLVRKNRNITLYLFDNAEPHPRIRILADEPNVAFIRTMSRNGIPYSDKYILYNIRSFKQDIDGIKGILETGHYLRLLIASSGFGVGSGLSVNAPKTWAAFKHAMTSFFDINSVKGVFEMKWEEWERNARLFQEELSPEMQKMQVMMQHEIEKKQAHWKLRAHLGFKKQQHQISVCYL